MRWLDGVGPDQAVLIKILNLLHATLAGTYDKSSLVAKALEPKKPSSKYKCRFRDSGSESQGNE
jgi:hypothetical protein